MISFVFSLIAQPLRATLIDSVMRDITAVMVHDVFNPPSASRIYAYTTLAGYEVARLEKVDMPSLHTMLNDMPCIPSPEKKQQIHPEISAAIAMYLTAAHFVYSEKLLLDRAEKTLGTYWDTLSSDYSYARTVSSTILQWTSSDGYAESRSNMRYVPGAAPGSWKPTPPEYGDAIEPYWGTLRPFAVNPDKINETLASVLPPAFETAANSPFHAENILVVNALDSLRADDSAMVQFWDDSPFSIAVVGHLKYALKKVSPAGHWLDITRTACDSVSADFAFRSRAYAFTAIVMADAFICTWKIKYETDILRPETYINTYIDPEWKPLLQSPPFPEFPSGHSAVSAAAAQILTRLFGENFDFTDASERLYGLPERHFASFEAAAAEAGYSRFLGGIHYLNSVSAGAEIGLWVSDQFISKLK